MPTHKRLWQDDGMIGLSKCGTTPIDLVLTAPDGPMGGDEGDDHYARVCPVCGDRLIARWGVRIEVLPPVAVRSAGDPPTPTAHELRLLRLSEAAAAWERADAALQAHYVEHGERPARLVNTLDKATTNLRTAILAAQPPQETTNHDG